MAKHVLLIEDETIIIEAIRFLLSRVGCDAGAHSDGATAVQAVREARPDLTLSICGEHGGNPESIAFCRSSGFDYVSCSPFRVPVARLAAAQLAVTHKIG